MAMINSERDALKELRPDNPSAFWVPEGLLSKSLRIYLDEDGKRSEIHLLDITLGEGDQWVARFSLNPTKLNLHISLLNQAAYGVLVEPRSRGHKHIVLLQFFEYNARHNSDGGEIVFRATDVAVECPI